MVGSLAALLHLAVDDSLTALSSHFYCRQFGYYGCFPSKDTGARRSGLQYSGTAGNFGRYRDHGGNISLCYQRIILNRQEITGSADAGI